MQVDRHVQRPLRGADAGDVIDMRVGQENVANRQAVSFGKGEQVAPSPGSMITASRDSSHATMNPFCMKGPAACVSMTMAGMIAV